MVKVMIKMQVKEEREKKETVVDRILAPSIYWASDPAFFLLCWLRSESTQTTIFFVALDLSHVECARVHQHLANPLSPNPRQYACLLFVCFFLSSRVLPRRPYLGLTMSLCHFLAPPCFSSAIDVQQSRISSAFVFFFNKQEKVRLAHFYSSSTHKHTYTSHTKTWTLQKRQQLPRYHSH